jgi:NAD(P)-dependent dehydrogenase (short-subunit alcohol dehydrogenase family)
MDCPRRHAVVTGATTGIGRATALALSRAGFHVYATVRRSVDGDALQREADGLTALVMDVTDSRQVAQAAAVVSAHTGRRGLEALVNNAGVGAFWPVEVIPLERFRRQLEVNVTGQLAVTQAFLPAIRLASGRIIMIGSIADRITMPFAGPVAAAKRALLALAEALRLELAPWNIRVVVVEPGSIRTRAVEKLEHDADVALREFGPAGRTTYGQAFERAVTRGLAHEKRGSGPDTVAAVVLRALSVNRPRSRYLVGKNSGTLAALAKLPPAALDIVRRRLLALPAPGSMAVASAASPAADAR